MNNRQSGLFEAKAIIDLRDMLDKSAREFSTYDAFRLKDENGDYSGITYKEFQHDVNALGTAFMELGLKDELIAVIGDNRYEWCVTYLSTVNGTGIIVPLDKELPTNEIFGLLQRSKATAIVASGSCILKIKNIISELEDLNYIIDMDSQTDFGNFLSYSRLLSRGRELLASGDRSFLDSKIDPESPNMLLFTSGTTDKSKGVMLSHKNICSDMMAVRKLLYADTNDSILSILPLHHTYECTCGFLEMVYLGVSISFCEGLKYISKNLQEVKPTILMSVPLILENVYNKIVKKAKKEKKYRLLQLIMFLSRLLFWCGIDIRRKLFKDVIDSLGGNLRLVISGAAALNPKVSKALRAMGLNIMQGYGLTETSPIVSVNRIDYYDDGSAGLPLPGVKIKIKDPDKDGKGEILVNGENVMLGYYNDHEASDAVISDGWFRTGDMGYITNKGFLYISGRKKNVIVTKNGKNIYPEDVELYLNKSEYIQECLVYGVDDKNSEETLVCAQIVPNIEVITEYFGEIPDEEDLNALISQEVKKANKRLTGYKKVKHFEIREEEFEKTTTKKIKRYVELVSLKKLNEMVKDNVEHIREFVEKTVGK